MSNSFIRTNIVHCEVFAPLRARVAAVAVGNKKMGRKGVKQQKIEDILPHSGALVDDDMSATWLCPATFAAYPYTNNQLQTPGEGHRLVPGVAIIQLL